MISRNISLREALKAARGLGCSTEIATGTGEVIVTPPRPHRRLRINCRRKDATAKLVTLLRRLEAEHAAG